MRLNIKRALYNDMLGNPDKTPATATEVAERMADLSRRMGSAFGQIASRARAARTSKGNIHPKEAGPHRSTYSKRAGS